MERLPIQTLVSIERDQESKTITQIAEEYGLSSHELTRVLLETSFIEKTNDPFCKYRLKDYKYGELEGFDIKEKAYSKRSNNTFKRYTLKFNSEGRIKINSILNELGIISISDYILSIKYQLKTLPKYCLIRRNSLKSIFIGYTKNLGKDDRFGLDIQPIKDETVELIKELMKDSDKEKEDKARGYYPVGPRIDRRNLLEFTKINNWMDKNFINKIDEPRAIKEVKKLNKSRIKLLTSPLQD